MSNLPAQAHCTNCGRSLVPEDAFCTRCGTARAENREPVPVEVPSVDYERTMVRASLQDLLAAEGVLEPSPNRPAVQAPGGESGAGSDATTIRRSLDTTTAGGVPHYTPIPEPVSTSARSAESCYQLKQSKHTAYIFVSTTKNITFTGSAAECRSFFWKVLGHNVAFGFWGVLSLWLYNPIYIVLNISRLVAFNKSVSRGDHGSDVWPTPRAHDGDDSIQ